LQLDNIKEEARLDMMISFISLKSIISLGIRISSVPNSWPCLLTQFCFAKHNR